MSTEIIEIEGKVWDASDTSGINSRTLKQQLSLTRFFGGLPMKGGRAMQITVGIDYIMLTPKQAWELGNTLVTSFSPDEIFPSS
tara:strand:- start:96 stop:347 length:252 start_codon:yes stop_codon:yes gene_type:complete